MARIEEIRSNPGGGGKETRSASSIKGTETDDNNIDHQNQVR